MEKNLKHNESRSRLPRVISNQFNGQQKCSSDTSSIPRSTKYVNNNKINNKLINCNTDRERLEKTSDNRNQYYKTINNYCETESYNNDIETNNIMKTSSLCKSQSLNEIQYEINTNFTKVNNFAIDCDAIKAFSYEQLDENYSNLKSSSFLTKEDINSNNNMMDMSIDESSTASLGLLPNILCSSISPFDTLNPNIPFILNETIVDKITAINNNSNQLISNDGDDDSENGIPVILEDESDYSITITENGRPVTPLLITDCLNRSINSSENYSLDNTMESMNSTVVEHEMAVEFETMNLDNAFIESNDKTITDNNIEMSIESNIDSRNRSETNIPNNFDNSLHEMKVCSEMNKTMKEDVTVFSKNEKSSQVIVKSFNESKTDNKVRVENRKSAAIRPNSLNTTIKRDSKLLNTEKVQRAASPSSKASVRKKIKTPGKWDAVMNKIELSKTHLNQNNKNVIRGRVNTNLTRNVVQNGSLSKMSPLSEYSIDMNSSHLTPSTPSAQSSVNSFNKKTTITNTSKANIPKSKTFVRDLNANNTTAGNASQQPLQEPQALQPVAVVPTQTAITSHTIKKGVVASINDKKATNRRPIQTNTINNTSKRSANIKSNASTLTKKDVRSAQVIDDKHQIQKLTELCEYKTKQLKTLSLDQNYMRLAFDSLSLVIQHLLEQYTPFENPKLQQALQKANKRCEQLKDNLDEKDLELNNMKIIYEEQINQLMKEREKNCSDLNQAKVNHESNVKKLYEMHSWEMKTLEDKHNKELKICQQNYDQLLTEIEDKNNELNQTKQLKDSLEIKVNQMEENIMNDKDKKFKYLTEKTKQLELEVDSLKSVMDMKNEKIHTLERQMIETQEKINELPIAKETIRGLQQQIENLQVTLERKIHQFNQLTREQEELKTEYDREMREKRRISMKNEELAYHLSESFNSESGFTNSTNYDLNHSRWKSPTLTTEETPIKTNRPYTSSASSRKSHSKIIKSMSGSIASSNSKRGPALYCRSSSTVNTNESNFLSNGISDEVFDSGNSFSEPNFKKESVKKSSLNFIKFSDETPPQCILDSGFEEIQGLNSLQK